MKNGKKFAALGLAGVTAVSVLTACFASGMKGGPADTVGEGKTSASDTDTKEAKGGAGKDKVKITVWTENRHDLEYMNKIVEEFNNSNDDIEINYVVQTENYVNLLSMAANSGQSPDLFTEVAPNDFKNFVDNGIVQPVNEYITDEIRKVNETDDHLYEGANVAGDDIYWVPCGKRSGSRIIYNKDIMDKLGFEIPKTIGEMPELVKKITEAGKGEYYGIIFPGMSGPFERWLEHSAEMSGVTPYDYKTGTFDFTGFKPWLTMARQMFADNSVFPGSASMKIDPARVQFSEGHAAIHANASQEATVLTEQFPAQIKWAVADLPTLNGKIEGCESAAINTGWLMSAFTEHPKEAGKVLEYFSSEDVLKGYFENGYSLPISKYMENRIDKSKIGRMADFTGVDYEAVLPAAPSVTPEGENWEDALWNACLADGPSIDETIAGLNKTYNEALSKEIKMGKTKRLVIKDYDPTHPNDGAIEYLEQ